MWVSKAKHLVAMVVGKEGPAQKSQIREPIIARFIIDFLKIKSKFRIIKLLDVDVGIKSKNYSCNGGGQGGPAQSTQRRVPIIDS